MQTDYIAPLALWVVVSCHPRGDGSLALEPVWAGSGEQGGLAIFVSRLHASVYAALRNACDKDDEDDEDGEANTWLCIPLQVFDLNAYTSEAGGTLDCAMVFGFACDAEGALIVADGAPRVRYFSASFELSGRTDDVTFSFGNWVFDAARTQWEEIGAHAYEESISRTEAMDDRTFARAVHVALQAATLTRDEAESPCWTVYDARTARWIATPAYAVDSPRGTYTLH
jgi:hypothetical protein